MSVSFKFVMASLNPLNLKNDWEYATWAVKDELSYDETDATLSQRTVVIAIAVLKTIALLAAATAAVLGVLSLAGVVTLSTPWILGGLAIGFVAACALTCAASYVEKMLQNDNGSDTASTGSDMSEIY